MRLIDADELKNKLQSRRNNSEEGFDRGFDLGIGVAMNLIHNAPTVTVFIDNCGENCEFERPKGEWVNNECPFCGRYENYPENFCATCGADMRGGADK